MSTKTGRIFQFGKFQIDGLTRTLRRDGATVKLNSRTFDVLLYLVQNPGRVLTRDELLKNVWRDAFVDQSSLPQTVSLLRRALDEKPGDHSYIVTLPGRGYQFVSAVQVVASGDGNTFPEVATAARSRPSGLIFQKHTIETSLITTQENKEQQLSSPTSRDRRLMRMAAAVLVAVVAIALLVHFRSPQHPEPKHEPTERQLTANPPEDSISDEVISRDGKYLAYADFLSTNLHLLVIDSGEVREIPLPAHYYPWDWFPDGNHLLLSGDGHTLWKISTLDSSLQKLWGDQGLDAAVSPDGSHIAFMKGPRELWLMGADGEEPHRILANDAPGLLGDMAWSPAGGRLAYVRLRGTVAKPEFTIETCDLAGGARTVVLSDPHLWGPPGGSRLAWLPDGRIVYSTSSVNPESNLWALIADPSTGKPSGDATRLTGWKNFLAQDPHASADGKRLVALRRHSENGIYIGDLVFGNKAFTARRFTADDWYNVVVDWTKDSKSVLFYSKRNGRWAIFRQSIEATTPETVIAGPENYFLPKLGSQGTILYTATMSPDRWEPGDTTIRLMSTPEQGGARSPLLPGRYDYACGSSSSSSCVVSELKDGQLIFSRLDPLKGRGEELARVAGYQTPIPVWGLSPDGTSIAVVDPQEAKAEIQILNLADRKVTLLPLRDWKWEWVAQISWAADGKSWFAYAQTDHASDALLSIDARGNPRVLQEVPVGQITSLVPSPDGKRLAFTKRMYVDDVMLLENF
jgi:DNA-binding winged helix-turn-helix (wHTH) protein/Tol biopolymer transport system component